MVRRHKIYMAILVLILFLLGGVIALFSFGQTGLKLISPYLQSTLKSLPGQVTYETLTGNLSSGYDLTNLKIISPSGKEALVLDQAHLSLSGFSGFKPRISGQISNLKIDQAALQNFLDAFPPSKDSSSGLPFEIGTVDVTNITDSNDLWNVDKGQIAFADGQYGLNMNGTIKGSPLSLTGSLGHDLTRPNFDLVLKILDGQGTLRGNLQKGFNFDGQNLDLSLIQPFLPSAKAVGLSGRLDGHLNLSLNPIVGDFELTGSKLRAFDTDLGNIHSTGSSDGSLLQLNNLNGNFLGGNLQGKGSMNLADPNLPLDLTLSLNKVKTSQLNKAVQALGAQTPDLKKINVKLESLDVQLNGPLKELNGHANANGLSLTWQGLTAQNLQLQTNLTKGKVSGVVDGSLLKGTVHADVDMINQPVGHLQLTNVDLSQLHSLLPNINLGGILSAQIEAQGDLSNPNLRLSANSEQLKLGDTLIDSLDLEGTGTLDQFELTSINSQLFGGTAHGRATILDLRHPTVTWELNAANFSTQGLQRALPQAHITNWEKGSTVQASGVASQNESTTNIAIHVPSGTIQNVKISDLTTKATLTNHLLTLSQCNGLVYGGRFNGQGSVGLNGDFPLDLSFTYDNADVSQIMPDLSGFTSFKGQVKGMAAHPQLQIEGASDAVSYQTLTLKNLTAQVEGNQLYNVHAGGDFKDGHIGINGTVDLKTPENPVLNLNVTGQKLDLKDLSMGKVPVQGVADVNGHLSGTPKNPTIHATATSSELGYQTYKLTQNTVTADFADGKLQAQAQSYFGSNPATAQVQMNVDTKNLSFAFQGHDLDISQLVPTTPITGTMSADLKGQWVDQVLSVNGNVTSPKIHAMDYEISNIKIPVTIQDNNVHIAKASAQIFGAPIQANVDGSIDKLKFNFDATLQDLNVANLKKPLKLPGTLSGKASAQIKGELRKAFTWITEAKGKLTGDNIEIKDVPYMKVVTSGAPIRIRRALINLNMRGDEVYIVPGSSISGWPDDTVFKYVTLSGPIWRKPIPKNAGFPKEIVNENRDPLKLAISSNVNLRALNGALGGVGVLATKVANGGSMDPKELAGDLLGGIFSNSGEQFRDVSLVVTGPYDHIRVEDLKIENNITFDDPNTWVFGGRKLKEKGRTQANRFNLTFEIPVGPGEGKGKSIQSQLGSQAGSQLLKQILKSIVPSE